VFLPIFFAFSYPILEFPLPAARSMGGMPGSAFRTSPTERIRRRTDGPVLTLVEGTGGRSRTVSRDVRPAHPGQPDFMPDGIPGDAPDITVQDSEPWSPTVDRTSRGKASLDTDGMAPTGSGPNDERYLLLARIAEFLEVHAGEPVDAQPERRIRRIH
jgi:hypothetical protein